MKTGKHVINRQTIELSVGEDGNAWEIQQAVAAAYRTVVLPVMDEVFSEISGDDILRLDRIELDIGMISLSEIERRFAEKVRERLHEALSGIGRHGLHTPEGPAGGTNITDAVTHGSAAVPEEKAGLELLLHFLRTGTLPWWAERPLPDSLEETFLNLLDTATAEMQGLMGKELAHEVSRHRLILQFPDSVLIKVSEVLSRRQAGLRPLVDDLRLVLGEKTAVTYTPRFTLWDTLLKVMTKERDGALTNAEIITEFLDQLSKGRNVPRREVIRTMSDTVERLKKGRYGFRSVLAETIKALDAGPPVDGEGVVSRERRDVQPRPPLPPEYRPRTVSSVPVAGERRDADKPGETDSLPEGTGTYGRRADAAGRNEGTEDRMTEEVLPHPALHDGPRESTGSIGDRHIAEGLHVANAGLVILWPYLATFFRENGLVSDTGFVDEASAVRALHLLQYLATGKEGEFPEYLLPLNKVLCGVELSTPVGSKTELSEKEREESERLLRTVISHWSALKGTTVRGFRESFLKREGILSDSDEDWSLVVERRAYDVLLERLPWGISVIRLSWMRRPLYVQW
ncbi:MAG: hypothetical protein GXO94_09245 [Nitrospirae bacterium]|nr:hypothetical protein [Nitrospirota bacterium]